VPTGYPGNDVCGEQQALRVREGDAARGNGAPGFVECVFGGGARAALVLEAELQDDEPEPGSYEGGAQEDGCEREGRQGEGGAGEGGEEGEEGAWDDGVEELIVGEKD
jgi:hypothetical protein